MKCKQIENEVNNKCMQVKHNKNMKIMKTWRDYTKTLIK